MKGILKYTEKIATIFNKTEKLKAIKFSFKLSSVPLLC